MQPVYREISNVFNNQILLTLPESIKTERVEVIVIPLYEQKTEQKPDFSKYFGVSNIDKSVIDKHL